MNGEIYYSFIDESGNLDAKNDNKMLVISALVTKDCLALARAMRTAEKKVRRVNRKSSNELKAAYQRPETRKKVLSELSKADISIFSVIFDIQTIFNRPYNLDEIYRVAMSILCNEIYAQNKDILFILDKRYTKEILRNQLSQSIFELIQHNFPDTQEITVRHCDSIEFAELRAADFVAYETYQKQKFDSELFEIIVDHIEKEIIFKDTTWEKIKKESKTPQ